MIHNKIFHLDAHTYEVLKLLFFALFGLTKAEDTLLTRKRDGFVLEWTTVIFMAYLLISAIVLINLLIAMMSDTYQRIQVLNVICNFQQYFVYVTK